MSDKELTKSEASQAIFEALRSRHSKDIVVEECKSGPTQSGPGHVRMDMWVMPSSWSKPACSAYEVKVSRSDFLKDDKWPAYLDLCNYLWFVCPTGMIQPEEVPDQCGLLWLTRTGTRLYTKRKAPHRDVEIPESLFRYVLMCRATIDRRGFVIEPDHPTRRLEKLIEKKRWDRHSGFDLRGRLRRRFDEELAHVMGRNEELERAIKVYDDLHSQVQRVIGREFPLDKPPSMLGMRQEIEALNEVIPREARYCLQQAHDALGRVVEKIKELNGGETNG